MYTGAVHRQERRQDLGLAVAPMPQSTGFGEEVVVATAAPDLGRQALRGTLGSLVRAGDAKFSREQRPEFGRARLDRLRRALEVTAGDGGVIRGEDLHARLLVAALHHEMGADEDLDAVAGRADLGVRRKVLDNATRRRGDLPRLQIPALVEVDADEPVACAQAEAEAAVLPRLIRGECLLEGGIERGIIRVARLSRPEVVRRLLRRAPVIAQVAPDEPPAFGAELFWDPGGVKRNSWFRTHITRLCGRSAGHRVMRMAAGHAAIHPAAGGDLGRTGITNLPNPKDFTPPTQPPP